MTRQDLINLVTTNFADASNITAAELRDYTDALLDSLYPASVTDSHTSETYTTEAVGLPFTYSLNMRKNGGLLFVSLAFTPVISGIVPAQNIFTWKNTNPTYEIDTLDQQRVLALGGSNQNVQLFLSTNVVATMGNTVSGVTYYANFVLKLRN